MKFKELREATLTKTQIKKVHDKADDLPKNDFIKRYGKDGDSVRFATATKMVKKELGIEDYEEGFKSDAQRKAAFASGYKEKGKKKDEALDDKDKETIKPIIKQLQKSVKAHDKQAKQLQKDIQDEVELDEALEVKWDSNKQGWFDKQGRRRYLGNMATNKLMSKAIDKAKETGDFINPFKLKHGQKPEETDLKEGYEGNILHMLRQKGIKGRFSNRKLYLKKGEDENAARLFLKLKVKDRDDKDNIIYGHEVPEIIGEETDLKEARWRIEGSLGYKRISPRDDFDMVIDAPTESAAEDKAYDELDKARDKRKIGPGGGGSVEDVEIETVERTNDRLSAPETFRGLT